MQITAATAPALGRELAVALQRRRRSARYTPASRGQAALRIGLKHAPTGRSLRLAAGGSAPKGVAVFRISIAILAGALLSLATAAAEAAPLNAGPPIEASATNPLAGCPPDGSGDELPRRRGRAVDRGQPDATTTTSSASTSRTATPTAARRARSPRSATNGGVTWTQRRGPERHALHRRRASSAPPTRGCRSAPTATLHAMSLVTDPDAGAAASAPTAWPTTARPTAALTWEPPIMLITDPRPALPQRQELDHRRPQRRSLRLRDLGPPPGTRTARSPTPRTSVAARSRDRSCLARRHQQRPVVRARPQDLREAVRTSRRSVTRLSSARRENCSTSSATSPTARNRRKSIGPVNVSFIVSDDHGEHLEQADSDRRSGCRWACSGRTRTVDFEPFPCPDPGATGACPVRRRQPDPRRGGQPQQRPPVRRVDGRALR